MSLFLDCSGLACPQPVLTTKKAVESAKPQRLHVLVDNAAALENVSRFLTSNGYEPSSSSEEGKWLITAMMVGGSEEGVGNSSSQSPSSTGPATPPHDGLSEEPSQKDAGQGSGEVHTGTLAYHEGNNPGYASAEPKNLVLILSPTMGTGDDELGSRLMKNFLMTLPEMGDALWRVVMLNGAVTLATHDSHVVDELQALEALGVDILVCGTCLEHFEILTQKAVGQTTNMLDVVTSLQLADKVIRI